jgi:hypothetical protein
MKTYSETVGARPFDWREFLTRDKISDSEWQEAFNRSKCWTTCACGNQCAVIPRSSDTGRPDDTILATLGGDKGFHGAIIDKLKEEALHFLELIEIRSAFLIKECIEDEKEKLKKIIKNAKNLGIDVSALL